MGVSQTKPRINLVSIGNKHRVNFRVIRHRKIAFTFTNYVP